MILDSITHDIQLTQDLIFSLLIDKKSDLCLSHLSPNISGFYKEALQYQDLVKLIQTICQSQNHYDIKNQQFQMNQNVVTGSCEIIINKMTTHYICFTFVYSKHMIIHLHISEIYDNQHINLSQLLHQSQLIGLCNYCLDGEYAYSFINDTLATMVGYTKQEYLKLFPCALMAIYELDRKHAKERIEKQLNQPIFHVEYRMLKKDGSIIWVLEQGQFLKYKDKIMVNSLISDITSLKNSELELNVQKQKYSMALKDNSITILEYDIKNDTVIIDIQEESKKKIYEHYLEYVSSPKSTVFDEDKQLVIDLFKRRIKGPIEIREHIRGTDKYVRKSMDSAIIYDENNEPVIVLATARDITTEWSHKALLEKKVQTDSLTHLLNLESGKEKINRYLAGTYQSFALCVLDIDYFKTVNDNYGHLIGNQVLIQFSQCLQSLVPKPHIVIRIGGDEFMILIKDKNKAEVTLMAENICQKARELTFEQQLTITISMGICFVDKPKEEYTFEQLFKHADEALYSIKNAGRNNYKIFSYHNDILEEHEEIDLKEQIHELIAQNKSLEEIIPYIGSYYRMNRISLLKLNESLILQHNIWTSSRSYQSSDCHFYLYPQDKEQLVQNNILIYQSNENSTLSKSFQSFLKKGVAKTIILMRITEQQYLSFVYYDKHRSYALQECLDIFSLIQEIL